MISQDGVPPGEGRPNPADVFGTVFLVDPSLFTAPYDARLSEGLAAAGVIPIWVTRPLRVEEEDELGQRQSIHRLFYPGTDGLRRRDGKWARRLKGFEHLLGLARLVRMVRRQRPAVVHLQWGLVPAADRLAIRLLQRICPVIMTVHDVEPFNGKDVAVTQRMGFNAMLTAADHLIVHTAVGRTDLIQRGIDPERVTIIPHGLLSGTASAVTARPDDKRWTVVQFGKIQGYKGVDILVEALAMLPATERARLRVIVAGEPLISLTALRAAASARGLDQVLEWRPSYHSNAEITALLSEADAFVFPYRAIEASGVLMLVLAAHKWIVASNLGAFTEAIGHSAEIGQLVQPGDATALAAALTASIGRRPLRRAADAVPSWVEIGSMTVAVYRHAAARWRRERDHG